MTRPITCLAPLFCLFVLGGSSWGAEPWWSPSVSGEGTLITEPELGEECGTLLINHNNTCEMPYAWRYGGVVPPDWGSFAECYSGSGEVCAAVFGFSSTGTQNGQTMDVFIYQDNEGEPGAVVCKVADVDPGQVAYWPSVSTHEVEIPEGCCVEGDWWVGMWPNWPGKIQGWATCGDLDGFGGCPLTKIAPGIGYPTGWQNVSVVWGPTQAMFIGARLRECVPTPVAKTTWGQVKELFR